jgi:hypothetical protein
MAIETPTKIALISKALILCGEPPLDSLTDDRYGAQVGANLFEQLYENELTSNRWRFAMAKKALSRVNSTPLNEWTYVYQLPSDSLLLNGVYPPQPYEIYGQHLYTNATAVEVEYTVKPDVSKMPAYFALLMTYTLAMNFIKPLSESDSALQLFAQRYQMQRQRALYADAQSRPSRPMYSSPFTDCR